MLGIKRLTRSVTPRTIVTICTIGLPVIVLLISVLLAQQTFRNDATNRAVTHTSAVRMMLQRVFSQLQDAETGQRGYLLTGQDKFLKPYIDAKAHIGRSMDRLSNVLRREPVQAVRAGHLRHVIADKMAELEKTIALDRAGDDPAAVALVATGAGYDLMTQARRITAEIQAAEDRDRAVHMVARATGQQRTFWFVAVLLGALAVLLAFSALTALMNYREGKKTISDVGLLTDQLQFEKKRLLRTVEELNAAKLAADTANQAKSDFLASMSHELRTPLNAILGFSEIIKDELFGPVGMHQYVDYANDVHSSGQHLLDLINDVLDLSKIQAGRVDLHEQEVDLSRLLVDSISLTRERANKGSVALVFDKEAAGPFVLADRRLLKQILLNLLSNAIKFTPAGGTVTAKTFSDATGIGISIQDTGIGMDDADILKAMSPYGQVDSQLSRKHKGTGLGLPISQSLAQLHGGNLAIESQPDRGTTITLILPLDRALAKPAIAAAG